MGDKIGERHYTAGAVYLANDPDRVQHRVRIAMFWLNGLLLVAFGLAVWRALSPWFAVAAVAFLVIDPTVAAHWPMALTDLPIALLSSTAFLLAFHAFRTWRLGDLVLTGIALGLALGAKHSAPAIVVGVFAMGAGMALLQRADTRARGLRFARVLLVMAVAWIVLWSFYRFRFNESPAGIDTFNRPLSAKIEDVNSPALRKMLFVLSRCHLLPRSYLWGLADVVRAGVEGRLYSIYFWNRYYIRRTPFYFFPAVVFFKLPIGLSFLIILGLVGLVSGKIPGQSRYGVIAMLCFAVYLFAVLAAGNSGYSGIRHALPIVPAVSVVAAAGMVFAWTSKEVWARIVCAFGLIGAALSAVPAVRPWEYYNELAGGSAKAYVHFADDGIDSGQRVKELAEYYHRELEPKGIIPYVEYWFYFNDEEFAKRGIRTVQMEWDADESRDASDLLSGTIIMNAKWLAPSPWADYGPLRDSKPTKRFGNLLIYQGVFNMPDARGWRVFLRGLANEYAEKPDLEAAESKFREVAAKTPKIFFANIELGNLLAERGARDEAIRAYDDALRYSPPYEPISAILQGQIQRIKEEKDPRSLPPVRDPFLE